MTKEQGFKRVGSTRHHVMLGAPARSGKGISPAHVKDLQTQYTPTQLKDLQEKYGYTLEDIASWDAWEEWAESAYTDDPKHKTSHEET